MFYFSKSRLFYIIEGYLTVKMLLVAIVFIALVAIIIAIVKRRGGADVSNVPWPFYAKKPLT
jgi:mannose/fructose/N-acetylgalactosamine-specific phosphotransferase system component IIC